MIRSTVSPRWLGDNREIKYFSASQDLKGKYGYTREIESNEAGKGG